MKLTRKIRLSVISCLLVVGSSWAQPRAIDKVVGMVGNEIVLYSDVQGQILEMIQNDLPVEDETECILFENFMYNALLLHQAEVDSIEANEEQIDAELDAKMDYYRNLLEQYGQTFESAYNKSEIEWREEIRDVMIKRNRIEQVQGNIASGVTITPREVRQYYLSIPKDSIPRINSQVEYGEIILTPKVSKLAEEREIARLTKWREEIISGETTFDYIAKVYSGDPGSASKGGSFDCVSRGMFVPEFDAVALGLDPGTISEPFRTEFGWHIVRVDERRGNTYCGSHILRIPKVTPANKLQAKRTLDSLVTVIQQAETDFCKAARDFSAQ